MSNKNITNYINACTILSFNHILFVISGSLSFIFILINLIRISPLEMSAYISQNYIKYFYLQNNLLSFENIIIYIYVFSFILTKILLIIISNYLDQFNCIELIKLKLDDAKNSYYKDNYDECRRELNFIRKIV